MWWSDRRIALLGLVALAGCGFHPVYGPGSAAGILLGHVQITAPETVEGYRLLQALRDRLGDSIGTAYDLTVTLDISQVAAATTAEGQHDTLYAARQGQLCAAQPCRLHAGRRDSQQFHQLFRHRHHRGHYCR